MGYKDGSDDKSEGGVVSRTGFESRKRAVVVLAALMLVACAASAADSLGPAEVFDAGPGTGIVVALTGVSVIPMDSERVLADHTVVVEDGRIAAVGPTAAMSLSADTRVVDGSGTYVMPGLADMHVHLRTSDAPRYVAAGVTTVRNLWGFVELPAIVQSIQAGAVQGPTVYSLSSGLDGTPAKWPQTQIIMDPVDVAATIDGQVAQGYGTLKLYQDLRPEVFEEIILQAQARGLAYGGHVPHRVGLERALDVGYRAIEHLSGYELYLSGGTGGGGFQVWSDVDVSLIPDIAVRTATAGVWNCPTLSIALDVFATEPGSSVPFAVNRRRMVKALHDAGAGLLVGTDSGIDRTQPGTSMHDELAEFVAAGLRPFEALRGATADAADFLGESGEFGRIAPGLRGDLVLYAENPLTDISAVRRPLGVMVRGTWRGPSSF